MVKQENLHGSLRSIYTNVANFRIDFRSFSASGQGSLSVGVVGHGKMDFQIGFFPASDAVTLADHGPLNGVLTSPVIAAHPIIFNSLREGDPGGDSGLFNLPNFLGLRGAGPQLPQNDA